MDNMNDAFKALAKTVEAEERDKAERRASGGNSNYTFESAKWTGLVKNEMKIIRALGGVPNSFDSPFTARSVRHSAIMSDKNKKTKINFPNKEDDPTWILWKVIDRVMDVDWVDKKKVYPVEKSHPEIFNIVAHNGFPMGSPQWKYDKGWAGRDYFIFNCIDRDPEMYKWSQTNKHSVLLSKQVNLGVSKDGATVEYPEEGVPAYGFVSLLAMNIFKHYGDWRNYDLGITRTGLMETPMRVINASKYLEEVPEELQPLVSSSPLTEEEKSWAMYDLDKFYGVSSYTKIWNNLKLTLAKIDTALGSHFVEELKGLAEDEAKERQAKNEAKEADDGEDVADEPVVPTAPTRPSRAAVAEAPAEVATSVTPMFEKLTPEEQKLIVSAAYSGSGTKWNVVYNESTKSSKKYACLNCGTVVPEEFMTCPVCGIQW